MDTRNLKRIFHWGPLLALSIICYISTIGFFALLLWWPPLDFYGQVHLAIYLTQIPCILYNFLQALYTGPGFLPTGWRPKLSSDEVYLQYCYECEGFKAPRSHHCRKCQRCVMKMDHHCPWVNTCVGHFNHVSFVLFLFFVPIGCIHAMTVLIMCCYRAFFKSAYHEEIFRIYRAPFPYSVTLFFLMILAIGLATGVTLCVGFLFLVQISSVIKNKTGIEQYICEKAEDLRENEHEGFDYPYDLGIQRNILDFWFFQNGVEWNTKPGCFEYALTMEQKRQKEIKRDRTIEYKAVTNYSGYIFPVSMGLKILFDIPCTDEPRMVLDADDIIKVTRGKKRWLYGQKVSGGKTKMRGWFPRHCAQPVSYLERCAEKKKL